MAITFTRANLTANGFSGWVTFAILRSTDPCPDVGGVYVVARAEVCAPTFLTKSCGGWFKDRDPTISIGELQANWVEGAEIVYIGKANSIRRRLKEFAKFGAGHKIGHWGGRLIWQLEESSRLLVAWKPTPEIDPLAYEAQLLAEFRAEYGKPPFANDPHRLGG
ncbi:GIY-YIG nuclease family protein [Erythrobacter sp. WG]|uniref:GIY-YIG nuclease family protein n=1 Tax=Erythrobacter sp. WG TaxID=2985510 RepID=UPI002271FC3D|nr:GIY-YIG nuclease family protein [Erythrobacter sp. WG]MCX9145917.1 GIY-YIG nuclease family protein [Erythrobacter sp. WG]